MTRGTWLGLTLLALASPLAAKAGKPTSPPPAPLIQSASFTGGSIYISGLNFGTVQDNPTLTLGAVPLLMTSVTAWSSTDVVAAVSASPGSYLLVLKTGGGTASFDVTVGAAGPAGAQGTSGGMLVKAADGTPLGVSFGVTSLYRTSIAAIIAVSSRSPDTWVLLSEQPEGASTPRAFVWRNVADGSAIPCAPDAWGNEPWIFYAGLNCTGASYVTAEMSPPSGFACKWLGQSMMRAVGPKVSAPAYLSRKDNGGCINGSSTMSSAALSFIDFGPISTLPAPLEFLAP